jgi:hypothetical protein
LEICLQGEFVFKSVGLVRIGSHFSGLVIKNQEKACINVVFVEVNTFKFIPEITLIADQIPTQFLLIKAEIGEMLVVASFKGLKVFFGLHFLFFGEGKNVSNFGFIIIKGTEQLSTGILVFKFIGVAQDLDMDNWAYVDFF